MYCVTNVVQYGMRTVSMYYRCERIACKSVVERENDGNWTCRTADRSEARKIYLEATQSE